MADKKRPDNLHLMVDIETLGNQPNCPIFAIGAATFDINTGKIYEEFYNLINPSYADNDPRFSYSASTIAWWCAQNEGATAQLTKSLEKGEDIGNALFALENFIQNNPTVKYWAKGMFDYPILSYHVKVLYERDMEFRKFRDMRTTLDEAEINPKDYPDVGDNHNALDDCKFQIICLVDAWKRVTAWKKEL